MDYEQKELLVLDNNSNYYCIDLNGYENEDFNIYEKFKVDSEELTKKLKKLNPIIKKQIKLDYSKAIWFEKNKKYLITVFEDKIVFY